MSFLRKQESLTIISNDAQKENAKYLTNFLLFTTYFFMVCGLSSLDFFWKLLSVICYLFPLPQSI
jgi:hypothetical protein